MSDNLDYKEAYLTMMRASERAVRGLELLQQGTSKIMLDIIKAAGGGGVAFESAD